MGKFLETLPLLKKTQVGCDMSVVPLLNQWLFTPDKDISFEHCGRPAFWQNDEVYCSKCLAMLQPDSVVIGL